MGRPRTGVDNTAEKALTRVICQEVFLTSGLSMAELETVFGLGTTDAFGRKTSKTFSRYCESDPAKSRAAPRDLLQRIVRTSLEQGWIAREQITEWGINQVLMLNHERANEIFKQRKFERDELVKTLRELQVVAKKAHQLIASAKSIKATLISKEAESFVWDVHDYIRTQPRFVRKHCDDSEDCPISSLPDFVAPIDLAGVLELLEVCLDQTRIQFRDGVTAVPAPDLNRLAKKNRYGSKPIDYVKNDFSDIDELLASIDKAT